MNRWLDHNGARLWYADHGSGPEAVVFVHGFACDHSQFAAQVEYLEPYRRVVAVDLRGHGRSDAPEQDYTMEGYADDVAWMCQQLGIERAVVVGHSMGGIVAAMVTARHPALVAGVVILDSAIVPIPELTVGLVGWSDSLRGDDYVDVLRGVSDAFFEPDDDQVIKAAVQGGMYAPQHVLVSSAAHMASFVISSAIGEPIARPDTWRCPVLHVSAAYQMNDVARFRELCPQLVVAQTAGSGHYHHVLVPEQINAMLARFLQLVG
jgi:pimeloyl-ACP methyl ester carboxylesterase